MNPDTQSRANDPGRSRSVKQVVLAVISVTLMSLGLTQLAASPVASAASSYMLSTQNLNLVPGTPYYFSASKNSSVTMQCWTRGPSAMNQNKWFYIRHNATGAVGYVPAPSVGRQTVVKLCPNW